MRAGDLNRRVVLQDRMVTNNIVTWPASLATTVWAQVNPMQGQEGVGGSEGPTNTVTSEVTIRFRTGVRPRMRVLYGGRTLEINAVLNDLEANKTLRLLCREVTS